MSFFPLPPQPDGVAWPTRSWPEAEPGRGVDRSAIEKELARAFAEPPSEEMGETHALLVVHRGAVVIERYGPEAGPDTTLISWSMAKSITHALVGVLVRAGRIDVNAPADVPEWRGAGDPRGQITLEHLLRMCDGLDFCEDYVDEGVSHVIEMLFREGKDDVAAYTAARPLAHPPGEHWNYSSGTSNVVARLLGSVVGGRENGMRAFMRRELFERIGMTSAEPRFDAAARSNPIR